MISITITGLAQEVIADMQSLLRLDPAMVPATKSVPKAKPSPEKAPVTDEDVISPPKGSSAAAKDGTGEPVTVDCSDRNAVKNYFSAAIDNLGPQLVQEVMAEHGAAKFGDIDPSKYQALVIRLSDLMQGKAE